jgi:hypothetical protein
LEVEVMSFALRRLLCAWINSDRYRDRQLQMQCLVL